MMPRVLLASVLSLMVIFGATPRASAQAVPRAA